MLELLTAAIISLFHFVTPTQTGPEGPENPCERAERWEMIGGVVAEVSVARKATPFNAVDSAALSFSIMRGESAFDYNVHQGSRSPIGHADQGRARCLGQLHQNSRPFAEWLYLAGLDRAATVRCVKAVQAALAYHAQKCNLRRDLDWRHRWDGELQQEEAVRLIRYYGRGNCTDDGEDSANMKAKAANFKRFRRKLKDATKPKGTK